VLSYNFTEIEKIEEFKDLHAVTRNLYFLPFELNMHASTLALQVSEHFDISYFAQDHAYHHKHMDSSLAKDQDTGLKLTIIYILNDDKHLDKEYG
jgi:hypothetical protein